MKIINIFFLGVLIFFAFAQNLKAETGTSVESTSITQAELNQLNPEISNRLEKYENWEDIFKYASFICAILSLIGTAFAGLILKLDSLKEKKNVTDLAAIVAAIALFLQVLNTSVGLNSRYIANRNARTAIQELQIRIKGGDISKKEAWDRIRAIHVDQSKL